MSMRRFVILATAIGAAIPILWLVFYFFFLRGNSALTNTVMSVAHFDRVLVVVWPSWLLLIADPEGRSFTVPFIAIAINALLYGVVGWLIWIGLNRSRLLLTCVAIGLIAGWFWLLQWYIGM